MLWKWGCYECSSVEQAIKKYQFYLAMFGAWPVSSFVASRLPAAYPHGLHRYLPFPTTSVKLTWPGVTYLPCSSGHVRRLTWPQGLTWLVTVSSQRTLSVWHTTISFQIGLKVTPLFNRFQPQQDFNTSQTNQPVRRVNIHLFVLAMSTSSQEFQNYWREHSATLR